MQQYYCYFQINFNFQISFFPVSLNLCYLIRKSLDRSVKKQLNIYQLHYLEANIHAYIKRQSDDETKYFAPGINEKIFSSLKEIINSHTRFESNDFNSYYSIFCTLFSAELLLLICFILNRLWDKFDMSPKIRVFYKLRIKQQWSFRNFSKKLKARLRRFNQKISSILNNWLIKF